MNLERIEELASRHVAGLLTEEERAELESRLSASVEARTFFAEYCMDEVLLAGALRGGTPQGTSGSPERLGVPGEVRASRRRTIRPRRSGSLLRAASLMVAFLGGWAGASVTRGPRDGPTDGPGAGSEHVAEAAPEPIPIRYRSTNTATARLVVHPLDFDESGDLSTNPFLQYVPVEATQL